VLPPILVLEEIAAPALGAFENDLVAGHGSLSLAAISYQLSVISYQLRACFSVLRPLQHQPIADT
jgi:hypothetical protein